MAKKIRELKAMLRKAGFSFRPGKGSHTVWSHPEVKRSVILSGGDGDDAKRYQEKDVQERIREAEEQA